AGQAVDLGATGAAIPLPALERLHAMKTGALLRAAVRLGAIAAGADAGARRALDTFAGALGLAFQVRDDLLDIEGDSATLGKTAGKDVAQDKATFPALIGADASRARLRELAAAIAQALQAVPGDTSVLAALARLAIERDRWRAAAPDLSAGAGSAVSGSFRHRARAPPPRCCRPATAPRSRPRPPRAAGRPAGSAPGPGPG